MSRASCHSAFVYRMPEGLPMSGKTRIEAKLGAILDDSDFLGKPLEYPLIQFT
jgi:hypothetical protein